MGTPKPASPAVPPIDAHLVEEEGRLELIDGVHTVMAPADEPHGKKHSELDYLLRAHIRQDFLVAVDMLTRAAHDQDFAPDVSVYPKERDADGKRQLDVLSFEIVGRQPMSVCTRKAEVLSGRGVRRIFAVDADENALFEWDHALSVWRYLARAEHITDPCFVCPLPVSAILNAADADDAVFDALRTKRNPALVDFERDTFHKGHEKGLEQGLSKGREEGLLLARRQAVFDLCEVLSVSLTAEGIAFIEAATAQQLSALLAHLKQAKGWPQSL